MSGGFPPFFVLGQMSFSGRDRSPRRHSENFTPFFRVVFFPEGSQNFGTELVTAAALFDPTISFSGHQIGRLNGSLDNSSS